MLIILFIVVLHFPYQWINSFIYCQRIVVNIVIVEILIVKKVLNKDVLRTVG